MISHNSSVYKLNASKSSRDVEPYDYCPSDETYENSSIDGEIGDTNNRYHGGSREGRYNNRSGVGRSRSTEFRSSKVNDKRSGYRGRGRETSSRRNDRDYSDNFYNMRKYESRNSESNANHRGKFYEPEKKTEIKLNLPEDTRISKLLRRLNIETNQENSLVISKKLLEVLLLPDNAPYVRKAFHILGESMHEILHLSPGPLAKRQAARALGRMGYIMAQENDFERYQNWLFAKMNNSYEEMQILLISTFKETLDMEIKKPMLENHIESLITNLVTAIETTENAEVFKTILEILVSVVEVYPSEFYSQFRDTIDLLFGWHVDHTQPLSNIEFISVSLQRLSHHFKYHIDFSVSLIENFLEDITNYATEVAESLDHVTVLILAMNTVLKCLQTAFHPSMNKTVKTEFVTMGITRIIKTLTDALQQFVPDNLIIAANECISLLLQYLDTKPQSICNSIFALVDLEMSVINEMSDKSIITMLLLISKVIKELSANLPIELIEKLIGPKSDIVKLRSSPYSDIQNSVICVYQSLLNLKNVSLLQEAYRYVLGDLEVTYKKIIPGFQPFVQNNPFSAEELEIKNPELTVLFLLRCLSQLANASSIIVMWALKPSFLELVGSNLKPYSSDLAKTTPYLQYSLLYLLYSHCKCYNHFISNSSLVTNKEEQNTLNRFALTEGLNINDVPNTSPNSGNFAIILDTLYQTLKIETSTEVTLLLLQWLNDILVNSENYLETLYLNDKFATVTNVLVKCGYHFNSKIVQAVGDNLEKLLSNKQLAWNNSFLTNVSDVCKLHMNSNNKEIRDQYSKLSANIPWDVAVVEFNKINAIYNIQHKSTNSKDFNNYMIYLAQTLHLNGTVDGEMYPQQFKNFMDYLLSRNTIPDNFLEEIFSCCWVLESESQMNMELFYDLAINSREVLNNWATLEAAQFCVNYKLRTPLGKPNETFTKIESVLHQLGNDLIVLKRSNAKPADTNGNRVRMLLHFVAHLEKSIYNAAEGTAMAMLTPSKNVRSFFIANLNTCNEWLARIRMVIMHIALHSGESAIALRHGQSMLKDLCSAGKADTTEFERVAMFVSIALLNLKEPEALYGLYCWCKAETSKRYTWIRCASEQASKKYEIAVEGYKKILQEAKSEKEDKKLDSDVTNFICDQIEVCYKELNNWVELFDWHSTHQEGATENGKKYWFNISDWDCNKNLFDFETNPQALAALSSWSIRDEQPSWSMYDNLMTTETNLYNIALNLASNTEQNFVNSLDKSLETIQKSVQDHLILAPSEFLQNYALLQYVATGLKNVANGVPAHTVFLVSENFENEINKIDSSVLRKILWWSEYFGRVQNQGFNIFCSNLRLDIIKRARKEKNFKLACTNVVKFFRDKEILLSSQSDIGSIVSELNEKITDVNMWTIDTARAISEVIKLSYTNDDDKQNTFNLCAIASREISKYAEMFGGIEQRKISSKILIKVAGWLQPNESYNITEMSSPLGQLIMVLPEIGMMENTVSTNIIPLHEMAVGKLLQFSVHQCVTLAKGWNAFGTWCYRWGKKIVDHTSDVKNNLTDEHCLEIKQLLPPEASEEDVTKVYLILSQTRSIIDEEDIDSNEINTSDMIKNQLQAVPILFNATEDTLKSLVQIWKSTQRRIYSYYALSAEAYFKYLHLSLNNDNVTNNTECDTITITLRLLRLIVKYALELQTILEEGLQTTPTQPWKVIIPQLFSRLNHPECYVRHRVSDLLCRVAEDAPQLITFPAVVGALEGGLKFDFSEITLPKDCLSQTNECADDAELNDDEDNDESDAEESYSNSLQTCFKTMVDTLSKQDPDTIAQVQTLVKELRRITLLWDELWLGTLAQHQSEIMKRQQQLEYEIEKVNENINLSKEEKTSLILEKHRIIIKPIVYVLEQLKDVTSSEPETPHEKHFQDKYMSDINDVIHTLKQPDNPDKPSDSLQPLRSLQKKFQQKFHKRASYSLKMSDISPVLHAMKNTLIAMPGLAVAKKNNVTISHISNVVSILPTKTKPKKLVFYGSDGQTYTYLFKGLEDLHLDERIMQFLSIANTMMAQNADPAGHNLYRARHYSVIPLGPRSGLISWVDGTTPVFALYKRWQQREIAKPTAKGTAASNASVLRPSELFYNKLVEHGVKNIDNRKEWPLSVLKQVLTELMAETPSDLLAKELWCNAISANVWWQVVKRYSYSVAVMSIIGYIIGLGDRHLDNMLVDLTTGDVVHIDYNVCFEKGKTLRVPEKVPFRLTPNIRGALGVTGVEGIFRLACENVLKTMRKGRETLLTLLEAFVYDPLVDWTVGGEVLAGTSFGGISTNNSSRQTKKDLEKEVTLAMFNVRCTEIKTEWSENKDEIITEISSLTTILNGCVELTNEASETEDQLHDLHHQLSIVKEAEAQSNKKHSLYKLPHLYEAYTKSQDAMNTAKNDLHSMIKQCDSQIQEFNNLVSLYEKQQFSQWLVEVKPNINEDSMHVFDLLKEFLHKAGKDDVVAQCEESEQEVAQFSQHLNIQIRKCTQLLQDFFTLLIQSPKSYMTSHKIHLFRQWALFLLETRSLEGCNIVYDNFRSLIETKNQNSQQILNVWYALDACYKDTLVQVNKLFDDLAALRTKDTNTSLEKLYNNAKVSVSTFLQSEKGAANALKFVIAGELLLLNRNMLTQEITASKSGDWLINLTSRDGAWFLDDLVMHSRRAVELIGNVPYAQDADDNRFYQIMNGIRIANNIYKGIYDLNFNFQTIILPESIKKIQADEESVLQMIVDVNNLVNDGEVCLQELIGHFEVLLTCVLMQMDVATVSFDKVTAIKTKFLSLLTSQTDTLSQGQMLLMGFNGLFEKLTQETNNLVSSLSHLDIPKSWKKLDHVKDAKSIAPHIFNPQVRDILENIFFLKRIQTISEFFALAKKMCMTVKGVNNTPVVIYTDELLTKPVKKFIAEYISRQLLGITPETITYGICMILQSLHLDVTREIEQRDIGAESKVPLDELYHKAYNVLIKDGTAFTSNVLAQASSLETNLKVAWDKIQEPKKIEQKLAVLQSSALRIQSQLAVYNLINGELLSLNNIPSVRAKFVLDMQSELGNLQTVYKELSDARERQQKLIEKAHQRLNWAKGANPNVIEISAAFENAVKLRDEQLTVEQNVANNVFSCFNIVIRHELLRSTTLEASKDFDKLFFNTYEKWKLACQYTDSKIDNLQPTEENILHMLTPEVVKDPKWLDIVSNQITDAITLYQNKLTEKKELLFLKTDNLLSIVNNFKCVYSVQTKLMSEVKSLIKTMTKIEEYAQPTQHFVTEYRDYTEHFTLLFKAFKEHLDKNRMSEIMQHLNYIADNTADIYEGLLNLQEKKFRPPLRRQSCVSGIAAKKQDSVTKGQQRNAYAVNVWRRVKMKLEGRDPDAGRKYTAQEQVDYVIREATNLDNLALLYEGWTPWV